MRGEGKVRSEICEGGEDREKLVLSEDGSVVSLACCHVMDLPYITAL